MKSVASLCLILVVAGYPYYAAANCPNGYCRHKNYCFLVVGLNATWIDARSYCSVLGGSLLSIMSDEFQIITEGALRRSKGLVFPGRYWLDVTDIINPKDWMYMSSRTSVSYTNMYNETIRTADAEPPRNCLEMSEVNNYKWTTVTCDEKLNFVCYASGKRQSYRYSYHRDDDTPC